MELHPQPACGMRSVFKSGEAQETQEVRVEALHFQKQAVIDGGLNNILLGTEVSLHFISQYAT